jgi:hypothetical protein
MRPDVFGLATSKPSTTGMPAAFAWASCFGMNVGLMPVKKIASGFASTAAWTADWIP